jgi:hypothetical protein
MHRPLRLLVGINLVLFASLLIATGPPIQLLRHTTIQIAIDDWWIGSTVAILVLFVLLLIRKMRGKAPSHFWIDVALSIAWLCAFVLILYLRAYYAGF